MNPVNAVAPLRWPSVTFELSFEHGSRIGTFSDDGFPVKQNRTLSVIVHPTVLGKLDWLRLVIAAGVIASKQTAGAMR